MKQIKCSIPSRAVLHARAPLEHPSVAARRVPLALLLLLAGCLRTPSRLPLEEDPKIRFPSFQESSVVKMDAEKGPHEMDGVLLKAIMIAARDFLPSSSSEQPCWLQPEAYRYRVVRQGEIIFVWIDEDLAKCGRNIPSMDSGAAYAIGTNGRILRWLLGSQTGELLGLDTWARDGGVMGTSTEVGSATGDVNGNRLAPLLPAPDVGVPGAPRDGGG